MRHLAMTGMSTVAMISRIFLGRGHAGDSAFGADLRGDALEGHDGDGAGTFGDGGLLGVGDVHDDAAFEHFGEAGFEAKAGGVCRCSATWRVSFPGRQLSAVSHQRSAKPASYAGIVVALSLFYRAFIFCGTPWGINPVGHLRFSSHTPGIASHQTGRRSLSRKLP